MVKLSSKVIIIPLLAYSILAPGRNLLYHYMDYEEYKGRENNAKSLEEYIFWNQVVELSKQRMQSNDIFVPCSYDLNKVNARYYNIQEMPIPKPNNNGTYII